ncbi:alpha/beta fold hydrolase [Methylobacter sp. sgz302048]|uniref:alpha/beta fold hydrolase n=1 Tax=Methylobacter sp. sgz302048 TaxID=3455945 RepID=UPI003FA0358B
MSNVLSILIAAGLGLPALSLAAEALRRSPSPPAQLRWAPDIPIQYVEVNGIRLRYIKTGQGPVLVLLHTLRTQLDLFEKIVPELAGDFTVYAPDLPGHGYSDIPDAKYDAAFFADAVEGFLEALHLNGVTLAGVSIGGAIPLIVAARHNPRVARVVAINPYDYVQGRGMARSSLLARLVVMAAGMPVLGETVMRLRNFFIMKNILEGGVSDPHSIPPQLLKEMYLTGNRKGHYRAFINLLRNAGSWQTATNDYARIRVPALLLWGSQDWARPDEREQDRRLVPETEMATIERGGHFLPLDRPDEVVRHLREFYRRHSPRLAS